jgi:hypothetical protein
MNTDPSGGMATAERSAGPRPPLSAADACALAVAAAAHAAILVEGWSDQAALEALALRRGRDLRAEGVVVVPIGGVTNVDRFVRALGPRGLGLRLAGLCDVADAQHVRRGLEQAGFDTAGHGEAGLEALGFFCCDADLADSRPSRTSVAATMACSCAASWARGPAGRSATAPCWSRHSIRVACRARSISCLPVCARRFRPRAAP